MGAVLEFIREQIKAGKLSPTNPVRWLHSVSPKERGELPVNAEVALFEHPDGLRFLLLSAGRGDTVLTVGDLRRVTAAGDELLMAQVPGEEQLSVTFGCLAPLGTDHLLLSPYPREVVVRLAGGYTESN
jgi:hypothetical protein